MQNNDNQSANYQQPPVEQLNTEIPQVNSSVENQVETSISHKKNSRVWLFILLIVVAIFSISFGLIKLFMEKPTEETTVTINEQPANNEISAVVSNEITLANCEIINGTQSANTTQEQTTFYDLLTEEFCNLADSNQNVMVERFVENTIGTSCTNPETIQPFYGIDINSIEEAKARTNGLLFETNYLVDFENVRLVDGEWIGVGYPEEKIIAEVNRIMSQNDFQINDYSYDYLLTDGSSKRHLFIAYSKPGYCCSLTHSITSGSMLQCSHNTPLSDVLLQSIVNGYLGE